MNKNVGRYLILISVLILFIAPVFYIIHIPEIVRTDSKNSNSTKIFHPDLIIFIIMPLISLFGYIILLKNENIVFKNNTIGLLLSILSIIFWSVFISNLLIDIFTSDQFIIIAFTASFIFFFWFINIGYSLNRYFPWKKTNRN
jgi:hypothetical protein